MVTAVQHKPDGKKYGSVLTDTLRVLVFTFNEKTTKCFKQGYETFQTSLCAKFGLDY